MTHIIYTLFPVFFVIGLGYFLARIRFLSRDFLNELNKFVYWISLPALMLNHMSKAEQLPPGTVGIWLVYISAACSVLLVGLIAARILRLDRWQYGTFLQITFRGNIGFIGVPVLVYALRNVDETLVTSILAQGVLVFAPTMVFYNVVSVLLLVGSHENELRQNLGRAFKNILQNPLVIAGLTGLLIFFLPFRMPVPVVNVFEFIGRTSGPTALICVGGGMAHVSMQGRYRSAVVSSAIKVFVTPVLAYIIALPFDFSPTTLLILMIYSATPSAVAGYIMAKQMHGDEAMASGGVFYSTILSVISLSIVIWLF